MTQRMVNVGLDKSPRDVDPKNVWPRERAHLLHEKYCYEIVTVMVKNSFTANETMIHVHYPTLYEHPNVLFVDTGDHVVVYYCEEG